MGYTQLWGCAVLLLAGLFSALAEPALVPAGQFDFGRLPLSHEVAHTFFWTNSLQHPMPVAQAITSCDCLRIVERPERLEPNAVIRLSVSARPTEIGPVFYAAFLEVTQPAQLLMFTLSGIVEDPDAASPPGLPLDRAMIEVAELQERLAGPDAPTLMDVRSQEMFVLGHIPGSLNLRFHELRGSALLRSVEVVLIHEGHRGRELAVQAGSLKTGRPLRVLDGGLRAWQMHGGPLTGLGTDSNRLFELDPGEMLRRRADPDWQWVLVTDDASPASEPGFASSDIMPVWATDLPAYLAHAAALPTGPRHRLLVDAEGQSYAQLEPAAQAAGGPMVFYMAGGWRGFAEASLRMTAVPRQMVLTSAGPGDRSPARSGRPSGGGGGCCGGRR